jgi:hypothetical protein
MKPSRWSLIVGQALSAIVFGGLNWVVLGHRAYCFDCGFARGVPFILFHDSGFFLTPSRIDWTGLSADIIVALLSGLLLAWFIHLASDLGPQTRTGRQGHSLFSFSAHF